MPGGFFGANTILVHVYFGTFSNGDVIYQPEVSPTGNNQLSGNTLVNGTFTSYNSLLATLSYSNPVEIVMPPNRRTQVFDPVTSSYTVLPTDSAYSASATPWLAGMELQVTINDTVREAYKGDPAISGNTPGDYLETFGGPKGKIELIRPLPINTRIRFRNLATFSAVNGSGGGGATLQLAYNGGSTITTITGLPVSITAGDYLSGGTALSLRGDLTINGLVSGSPTNGIFGSADQAFIIGDEANKPASTWTALQAVKSETGFTGSAYTTITAGQVTTTNTPTPITGSNITLATGKTMRVTMVAVGRDSAGAGHASYRVEAMFINEGGTATLSGSPMSEILGQDGTGTSTALIFGISGSNIVQGVLIGVNSATWYWTCTIEYQIITTST
jgi:hypothetical protein